MNHGLLLLFLLTSCWFYIAALLFLNDRRWNIGRIVQSLFCTGVGVSLLPAGRVDKLSLTVVSVLFGVTVVIPLLLQRVIQRLLRRGRIGKARLWHRLMVCITWGRSAAIFREIERINTIAETEFAQPRARHGARYLLLPIQTALSRASFVARRINALVTLHHHEEAVALYEESFVRGRLKADAILLFTMAIAYAELDALEEAIACIRRAEERDGAASSLTLRAFLARIRVFAFGGYPDDVEALFTRHPQLTALLPPAYPHLWRGVGLMRSGESEGAEGAFERALIQSRPAEELLRKTIERRLGEVRGQSGPAVVSVAAQHQLDGLRRRPAEVPPSAVTAGGRWRPHVTWGFVIAGVLVWLLTERVGSSTDAHTLLRFGANMPQLVLHGHWWRLVSSMFLHVGGLHLVLNMYACYLFGAFVERTTDRWGVFTTFILSGFAGGATSALLGSHAISAGASGAVFGLLGAAIVIVLRLREISSPQVRKTYAFNFIFIAALNMVFGLLEPRIDNLAHAGGFAAGTLCGLVLTAGAGAALQRSAWRLASFLSVALLVSATVGAAYNVHTGGYPHRPPPFRSYIEPSRTWKVSVPVFWHVVAMELNEATFYDPLGPMLQIQSLTRRMQAVPGKEFALKGYRKLGGRVFLELVATTYRNGVEMRHFLYQTFTRDRQYVLQFECTARKAQAYRRLFDRILAGFEPAERILP